MTSLASLALAACAVYTISNRTASVSVDDAGRLVSLRNLATGTEWSGGGALWRLYYDRRTADGSFEEREIVVTPEGQTPSVTCDGSRIVIRYDRLDAGGPLAFSLALTVTAEESGLVRFASELKNDEPNTCVRELHYPLVGNLRLPDAAELFTTEAGGRRCRDPLAAITSPGVAPLYMGPDQLYRQMPLKYPSIRHPRHLTSNCFAFWTAREGLYFGSHDPTFQETWHLVRAWPDATGAFTRVEAGFGKYPNAVCGDTWRCAANVVAPYAGGWGETAKIYRRWADTWWDHRPTPRWIREMRGWQRVIFRHQYGRTFFTPDDLTGRIADAGRSVDVNAVLCFGWWRSGMDNGYPDSYRVTDSDEAWKKAIADYRAAGGRFIQYYNGKLIDVESDFYRKGPGARIAMRNNVGEPVIEQYKFTSSGTFTGEYNTRAFAMARQDAPEWRTVLSNCVRQAISFGADSVFFDQLGYLDSHPDWTHRGGFAIPVLDGILKKAESLRLMRDLVVAEAPPDFGFGTEYFTDVCMQYADYVHNLVGGTDPENFTDWTLYAFPEVVLSDREIRDDVADVDWRVNHNLLLGLRSDIEVWRCRGLISETPRYRAALARINALRRAHPVTLTGQFRGTDGLANSNPGSLLANVFVDGDRASVVVTSRAGASGTISLEGWSPKGPIPVTVRPGEAKVLDFTRAAAFLPFDTLTCEVTGCAWGCGANKDPTFATPKLVATLRGANGHTEDFVLADVCWEGTFLVNRRFSAAERARFGGKAEVADVRLTGGDPARNAAIRVGEARLFTEALSPLKIDVTPRERLPFPTRADTVVPATPDPQDGDLLADWKVSLPEGCTVVRTRKGKSLVIDITAPAGAVTEIPTGVACEARKVKDFFVPFLTWGERDGRIKADLLEGGWYRLASFDWTVSNASDVYARETPGGRELVARYKPKTDGTYNPVRERIVVTLSRDFDEILPEIPNPKSPYKRLTGTHVWRAHASFDRADDAALWRKVRAAGLAHVAVTDHETMWRDHGEPFTFCTVAAPGKGGDDAQRAYARTLIDELGYLYGPYNNFTDLSTQSGFFSRDAVARREDGSFQSAWMRCYAPKPVMMPAACERFAGELKRKFGFNTGYCDVHTSMLPWQRTDYDARVPGAAMYAQTFCSWGETLLKQKEIWQGPVYSEGSHQFPWAGLADGSYGQDRSYDFRNEPWLVDFELRRTQRLCTDFGMGSLSMFSPARTELERTYYLPGQPKGRNELVNRFLAATIAFGHSGYLILDGCWEPAKPFGPAYGVPCKPVWKEKGLPAEALRSYFMIQALAARYTQSEAEEILYAGADGRLRTASEAIADGSVARNQVVTRYADGTVTAVNGSDSLPMKTRAFGREIDLSPNGFAGWGDGVKVLSTDVAGTRRHYADGPEYTYVEDEGRQPVVHLKSRYVFPRSYGRLTGFAFGNGHYVKNPGAFSIIANGHHNATSYDGFEFENGKAVVVGAAAPITRVWWDPKTGEAGVACDEGAPFRFVESTNGLFAAAFEYRRRYPRTAAAGVKAKAGKFCVDVWNGTFRQQAEFVRRAAAELKITNDVFLCTHVWQRHGYDNGLPEVWPPDPAFGTAEDLKDLARTCRENGWGFGVHHNVIDFYTNATCFTWADIARNERQEPLCAWLNAFRKTQSWRMAPEVAASYMRRSLDEMNAAGFSPDMLFVDVIGSFPAAAAAPYFTSQGRWVGPGEMRRQFGDVFETIREVQSAATGRAAFTASEAAHDYLVGRLDGGDCQWMEVTREPGEYCWNVIPEYEDAEKIPWFDAVNHAVFSLHGAGYSIRYEAGRGELDHGIDSDDYLNAEILSGHALMTDCYSRDVRDVLSGTVRPLDMERCLNQLKRKWTLAQPVARELAGAEMTGHEFVGGDIHRQKVTWSTGMTVYANRGATDWTVEGVTLPPYGFLAVNPKTGVRAEISREKPRPRVFPKRFLDVTPEEIVRNPRGYQLHFWLAKRKPTENAVDCYDRLLTARDETPADAPKGEKLDRLVTVTDAGADPYDVTARYYLNGVPSFDRRFYLKDSDPPVCTNLNGKMKMNELEIHEYPGEGYKRMVNGPKWTVAALNYAAIFDEANFKRLERHNLTDESFVLLAGEATLLVGEKAERVQMAPLKVYNVPAGVWHHIFVSRDARVLVIENSDTSKANSEYLAVR